MVSNTERKVENTSDINIEARADDHGEEEMTRAPKNESFGEVLRRERKKMIPLAT
jgi:hypothetical protein